MKHNLVVLSFFFSSLNLYAQEEQTRNFMPVPQEVTWENGRFDIDQNFTLSLHGNFDDRLYGASQRFLRRLQERTGVFFEQAYVNESHVNQQAKFIIEVERAGVVKLNEDESYSLQVNSDQILLKAKTDIGAIRGLETLLQTFDADRKGAFFMTANIQDSPRFPWRGLMLDVSRHFHPMDVVKRQLDAMAAVKMNVLHMHLADDQGFRIESKALPKLHELASEGEYFTQDEIREIIAYADDRGIRVMPEFDMPGHATAMILAYPEMASAPFQYMDKKPDLSPEEKKKAYAEMNVEHILERHAGVFDPTIDPTNEKNYELINLLIDEMTALFPDEYFHIGGDENEYKQWADNDQIQAFMKENDIPDHHMLQNYFNTKLLAMIQAQGKKMMGWDEILVEGLPKDAIIQSWRGKESLFEAAEKGYTGLLSNGYYIDLMHSVDDHYTVDPLEGGEQLSEEEQKSILGGEATMWSELVTKNTIDSRIWPRTAAIAERLWSSSSVTDLDDMHRRLDVTSRTLEEFGLKHITQPNVILRNIARSGDIAALKVLTGVAEPMEHYNRNPLGLMYTMQSPYTLFADACIADAPDARVFRKLVEAYLAGGTSKENEIKDWLHFWSANHEAFMKLREHSSTLAEVEPLSENLSKLAEITLESFDHSKAIDQEWYHEAEQFYYEARKQQARTILQVVKPMEKLFKNNTKVLYAKHTTSIPKIDCSFSDWNIEDWSLFTSEREYVGGAYRTDSAHYALQWDENNLYVALRMNNFKISADKKYGDALGNFIELIFETEDQSRYTYLLQANNKSIATKEVNETSTSWKNKIKSKVIVMGTLNVQEDWDEAYQVEIAIPWKDLNSKFSDAIKMNMVIHEKASADEDLKFDYLIGTSPNAHLILVE
ncbi:family 20 glycosylhydrolase [Sediminitomix flava]|nr:family 20 glycosylhydrolase [Sediminitomix flava]